MNTVNRRPRLVDTPTSKQIQTQYFHQNEWKGICEDKNTFGVDQNTFAECENVYIDRDNVLSNRPGLSFLDISGDDYKVYLTKSYIVYYGEESIIVKVNEKEIIKKQLSFPQNFNEDELYFYEIGNTLFAFGAKGIYKLLISDDDYSMVDALENVLVPDVDDVRNLLVYNNFTIDANFDYSQASSVIMYPEQYSSPSLTIKANSDTQISEGIINNVITNWPYSTANLNKTILKNASQLETTIENPVYENLYYINSSVYTNGGFQNSITVEKNNSTSFKIKLFLYDDTGSLVGTGQTYQYTLNIKSDYGEILERSGATQMWFKVDYTRSKSNILGVAIVFHTTTDYVGLEYIELNFSSLSSITVNNMYRYISNALINLADFKSVPFCFYYNYQKNLSCVALITRLLRAGSINYYIVYYEVNNNNFNNNYISILQSTGLRSEYILLPITENNVAYLLENHYFGRITNDNGNKHWTFVQSSLSSDYNYVEVSWVEDNVSYFSGQTLSEHFVGIELHSDTLIKVFSTYGKFLRVVNFQFNSESNMKIKQTYGDKIEGVYPSIMLPKIYLEYCLLLEYDEPNSPFGTLLLNKTEYLQDAYFDGTNIIILSSNGKLFSNLSSAASNIIYTFYSSSDLVYTGQLPTLIRPIGSNSFLFFVKDTSYLMQVRYNYDKIILYMPENKENKYYDEVIDSELLSDTSLLVIGNNVLYTVIDNGTLDDKQLPVFQYIQSKLNLRVIPNSESIIAYNSSTVLCPTYNGMAAVNYSQLISVEEQTVNYITDNVMTHWFNFVKSGTVKTCNHNYYLFVYNTDRTDLYMFDYRSNTWWYFTFEKKVKLMHTIGLYCFIVFEDNALHYFDEKVLDAQWSITSQKLYLGNNTNYKQIRRFTVHTIGEKSKDYSYQSGDGDNVMTLQFTNYRKRMYENDDETFNFNVDFVRTYVIRLNYPKVYEFQYKLSSNKLNLKPLQLTGITIEYKVGGKVR